MICAVVACERRAVARGFCHSHYEYQRRTGRVPSLPIRSLTADQRFASKVDRRADGCWIWLGATDGGERYGSFWNGERVVRAHRWAYERLIGPIPEWAEDLDHLCRNTLCVNPRHLEPVTHRENVLRGHGCGALNARKTHCKYGHELTADNLVARRLPRRQCLTCTETWDALRKATGRGRSHGLRYAEALAAHFGVAS